MSNTVCFLRPWPLSFEKRDTGGSILVMAVPAVGMAPSRKALSMKARASSAFRFSSWMMRSSSSAFFGHYKGLPLSIHLALGGHGVHELLDEVLLVAQARAGIDRALDIGADLLVLARAFLLQVLLHQHQDVIDVDLDLFDQLDLEHHVVVDAFLLRLRYGAEFGVQIQVDTLVVLKIALAEDFIASEVVESGEDVFQPQDGAEQLDESLLSRFARDRSAQRKQRLQLGNLAWYSA